MALNLTGGGSGSGGTIPASVELKGRFEIRTGEPLPAYDNPPAVAYTAIYRPDRTRRIFALICDPKMPPRSDQVAAMHRIDNRHLMRPLDWGIVDWPVEGRRCPALFLDRPGGERVMPSLDTRIRPMPEEEVSRLFIQPMSRVLSDLDSQGLVHRAIRPDNLFWGDSEHTRIILGDCLSAPVAMTQPVAYETIPNGMAQPAGRGPGTLADDLYALGVTILALLIGRSPCQGMSDEQILREKMSKGSYAALLGGARVSLTMMEVLRGLLSDDLKDRWTVDDLGYWVSGRRQNPRQPAIPRKAARGFRFEGGEYLTTRELAHAFSRNWEAAAKPIRDGSFDIWVRRGFADEELIEAINEATTPVAGIEPTDDWLVSRVCVALDPNAPIRYREFRATLGGIAQLLAMSIEDDAMCAIYRRIIREGLIQFWIKHQRQTVSDHTRIAGEHDRMRSHLDRKGHGLGVERVAYGLNPNLPCRSPLLANDFVLDPKELPAAFDRLARQGIEGIQNLVDKHVAAMVAARYRGPISAELRDLDNQLEPHVATVAGIRIIAMLQDRQGGGPMPALAALAAALLEPTVDRFHSRTLRKQVRESLKQVVKSGRLGNLLDIVDNRNQLVADRRAFEQAVAAYAQTVAEADQLEYERANRTELARELGAQIASLVSGTITSFATLVIFIIALFW